jgi:hypothetical protein
VKACLGIVPLAIEGFCNDCDRLSGEYSTTSFSSFQALLKLTCGTTGNALLPYCWKRQIK